MYGDHCSKKDPRLNERIITEDLSLNRFQGNALFIYSDWYLEKHIQILSYINGIKKINLFGNFININLSTNVKCMKKYGYSYNSIESSLTEIQFLSYYLRAPVNHNFYSRHIWKTNIIDIRRSPLKRVLYGRYQKDVNTDN